MKNTLIFIAGLLTGSLLTFLLGLFLSIAFSTKEEITLFETEGEYISNNSFQVSEVLDNGNALAYSGSTKVLFLADDNKSYYDRQIIDIPSGYCAKQIGIYKDGYNTVPVVAIKEGYISEEQKFANKGITLLEEPGEIVSKKPFEVSEVLESGDALAREIEMSSFNRGTGIEVLFVEKENTPYYDGQIIKIPSGKSVRQIGIFKRYGQTIPVVDIMK